MPVNKMKTVMLAPNEQITFNDPRIKYPMLLSPKYDGNRCLVFPDGRLLSRSLKDQPNKNLSLKFMKLTNIAMSLDLVFDLEIYSPELEFSELQAIVRSHNAPIPDHVNPYVFDVLTFTRWESGVHVPFFDRYKHYMDIASENPEAFIPVIQHKVFSAEEAEKGFITCVELGYEGVMLKSMTSMYKHGRATLNEGTFFKFKDWALAQARVVGFVQRRAMKPDVKDGERTRDRGGFLERTHKQEDYMLVNEIGAFLVEIISSEHFEPGVNVKVGLSKGLKGTCEMNWMKKEQHLGRSVEIKFQAHGSKDKPRIGKIVYFRDDPNKPPILPDI